MRPRTGRAAPGKVPDVAGFPHYSALSLRLSDVPDPAWKVHALAMQRAAAGEDVIILSIGEPDSPPPPAVIAEIEASIERGRTRYSHARGEPNVVAAICEYASRQAGRTITPDMVPRGRTSSRRRRVDPGGQREAPQRGEPAIPRA